MNRPPYTEPKQSILRIRLPFKVVRDLSGDLPAHLGGREPLIHRKLMKHKPKGAERNRVAMLVVTAE